MISFVGAGPGAADLLTLRGHARLAAADVVVWASSLVPAAVLGAVRERRPETVVETVPGITAFQALAARSGTVLLTGTERLCLVTAVDGPGHLEQALDDPGAAVVVYKGGRHLPEVAKRLADAGRLDGAVAGELLGLPGERVGPAADLAAGPATYLVTVIVPPAGEKEGA